MIGRLSCCQNDESLCHKVLSRGISNQRSLYNLRPWRDLYLVTRKIKASPRSIRWLATVHGLAGYKVISNTSLQRGWPPFLARTNGPSCPNHTLIARLSSLGQIPLFKYQICKGNLVETRNHCVKRLRW